MKRVKIKSGDLLRIPLWNNLGFAYAKYIDLSRIPEVSYGSLIKVYDYWTKNKEFDLEGIKRGGYLIQAICIAGIIPTLRHELWEIIGNIELTDMDSEIPQFKGWGPIGVNEADATKWYYFTDCKLSSKTEAPYANVSHLEDWGAEGTGNVEIRITMQILIKEGLDVSKFFDLKDESFNYQYKKALEIPLLTKLPRELWGKAKV